jgi:hypothetical protein
MFFLSFLLLGICSISSLPPFLPSFSLLSFSLSFPVNSFGFIVIYQSYHRFIHLYSMNYIWHFLLQQDDLKFSCLGFPSVRITGMYHDTEPFLVLLTYSEFILFDINFYSYHFYFTHFIYLGFMYSFSSSNF